MASATLDPAMSSDGVRVVDGEAAVFQEHFNRAPFAFQHRLADHPLFEVPRLAAVAETMIAQGASNRFFVLGATDARAGSKFSSLRPGESVADGIRNLERAGSWMKLSNANLFDPDYSALLDRFARDIEDLTGFPLRRETTWSLLTVFLASPGIVTPYHIDHESNFLIQIRGEKDVCLFDPEDRSVLTQEEIERFYTGDPQAADYRDDLRDRGRVFRLAPGVAVHHPPLAPHWVKNGPDISVSVSISFCLRGIDRRARVHQANIALRRLGLRPSEPGRSSLGDRLKVAAMGALSTRRPENAEDMLYSGVRRLARSFEAAKRIRRGPRAPA